MSLNKRQQFICDYLITQNTYKTVSELASRFRVSTRTIHSDLNQIQFYVKDYELIKKPGVGVILKKEQNENSKNHHEQSNDFIFNSKERQRRIAKKLLFNGETISIQNLANEFFVSKTSIVNDLKVLSKDIFVPAQIQLIKSKKGTKIYSTESQLQTGLILYNELFLKDNTSIYRTKREFMRYLSEEYGKVIVQSCYDALVNTKLLDMSNKSDFYFNNLLSSFVVLTFRVSLGYHIEEIPNNNLIVNEVKKLPIWIVANDLINMISRKINCKFTQSDISYFTKQLIANRFENGTVNLGLSKKFEPMVNRLIDKMSAYLYVDFQNDKKLKKDLLSHITFMMFRLKNGIHIKNPLLYQIKDEFRLLFDITRIALEQELQSEKIIPFEDEVAYLVIYFQGSLDRQRRSRRILIVCPNGFATSELVANRVRQILPPLDIVEVTSTHTLENSNLEDIDLLISTVPLKVENKKCVLVSPLMNDEDVSKISKIYNESFVYRNNSKEKEDSFNKLKELISFDFIDFNSNYSTMEEVIIDICQKLEKKDYILPGYADSVLKREERGGTDLNTHVAIPHGNPKLVKQSVIYVCRNNLGIKWNTYTVRVILLLCLTEQDIKNAKEILKELYMIIENKEQVDKFFLKSTKSMFYSMIGGNSHY